MPQTTTYQSIDLSTWKQVGEGGNGITYENPDRPDVILKVNKAHMSTLAIVQHEFEVSKAVEPFGLSVPKAFEIVKVGDAYGTLTQRIHGKKSLSRICHDEPERTEEMARLLSQKGKELHATPCNTDVFPSRKEQTTLKALDQTSVVSRKDIPLIRSFVETIPDVTTCVHGDFQSGNLIQSGDQFYWIDLDRFAYGNPMFDIGHLFQICHDYAKMKQVHEIFHMSEDQLHRFWDAFAKDYTGKEDYSSFDRLAGKFACLDIIHRSYLIPPTFVQKIFFRIQVNNLVKQYYK